MDELLNENEKLKEKIELLYISIKLDYIKIENLKDKIKKLKINKIKN